MGGATKMYTPHTVTLFNEMEVETDNGTEIVVNATILKGVFLDELDAAVVSQNGLNAADSASLYIPFSVAAYGLDGNAKSYIQPKAYAVLEDATDYWTLDPSGRKSINDCYFCKGEYADEVTGFADLNRSAERVYRVTGVYLRDFGTSDMQHWQVTGK